MKKNGVFDYSNHVSLDKREDNLRNNQRDWEFLYDANLVCCNQIRERNGCGTRKWGLPVHTTICYSIQQKWIPPTYDIYFNILFSSDTSYKWLHSCTMPTWLSTQSLSIFAVDACEDDACDTEKEKAIPTL